MGWYIGRRLMQMIPVFFGATLLIYAMVFAMPGDPILALGGQHTIQPAVAAQIRAQFHLDQPFYIQYYEYIKGALTLNFGTVSYTHLRAHETDSYLVCRLLLEKKK